VTPFDAADPQMQATTAVLEDVLAVARPNISNQKKNPRR
jgi:hypothetical protein